MAIDDNDVFTCQNMAIFRNPSKVLNIFLNSQKKKMFCQYCFKRVQGHQKNRFYRNHISDVTMKN